MDPFECRARFKACLLALGARRPTNASDIVAYHEGRTRTRALVRTADHKTHEPRDLLFPDGTTLRFLAVFEKGVQGWELVHYSFHVERAGAYFRYDLDHEAARGMQHPLAHLHLNADVPRYPTGRQNLVDLLSFLVEQNLV